jgi:peptidoglycan hydrolase-like protein with peptidoglycan-binding domain
MAKRGRQRLRTQPHTPARGPATAVVSGAPVVEREGDGLPRLGNRAMQRHLRDGRLTPAMLAHHQQALGNRAVQRLAARARQHSVGAAVAPLAQRVGLDDVMAPVGGGTATLEPPATTGPADLPPPEARRMIRQGSTGREVEYAQERLNAHGAAPPLAVDGIFGPLTRKATVAYQETHGLVPDAIIGPRTWGSLDGPTRLGGSSGSGSGGAGGPGSTVMLYDTGSQRFSPPAAGTKMTDIRDQIKAKQDKKPKPDLGKTVSVTGVKSGSDEEIFVWNALLQRAERQFWGGEIDVVTQIGPAPKGGGAAPVGQITIKIDGQGNATAELLNRGAVAVPSALPDKDAAVKALKADFGFSSVDDGSATWSLVDLNKVHAALSRLPAADRAGLAGVKLVRDRTLTDKGGNALSGEFRHEASVTAGSATTKSVATRSASLHIADLAFANDDISFIGDKGNAAVASFHTIVHEAGHAVETKALRDAQFATFEAQAEVNNDTQALNAAQQATNAAVTTANADGKAAIAKFNKYKPAEKKSGQPFATAFNAAVGSIDAFANNNTVAQFSKLEAAATKAIANRDAAKAKLPAGHAAHADFASAIQSQDAWFAAAQNRAKAAIALDASKTKLAQKKKDQAAVSDKSGKKSKRLENFVAVVNKNKIPPLTEYAKQHWPNEPEEFFAEAYSFWLNDPVYLEANARPLKAWFDAGEHLK